MIVLTAIILVPFQNHALRNPCFHGRHSAGFNAKSAIDAAKSAVETAIDAAAQKVIGQWGPSEFEREQALSADQLVSHWAPFIADASKRFGVPAAWIRAVMRTESGGRTMLAENQPITSNAGAMGLMQLMPGTYKEMRKRYGLGSNPYDPHDNILAGAAYLSWLRERFGYPQIFAAYNAGPGRVNDHIHHGKVLPDETRHYVERIAANLQAHRKDVLVGGHPSVKFTRPNGKPVWIPAGAIDSVRAALPGEYAPSVRAVISVGRTKQGVLETVAKVRSALRTA